jgi:hypothetical protein
VTGPDEIEISIPEGASPEEEERLIQAAIDKRIGDDLDGILAPMQ